MRNRLFTFVCFTIFILPAFQVRASELPTVSIAIKDHTFVPAQVDVPSGQKFKLIVDNQDATEEEFESYDLNREKIVEGNSQIAVYIGPLKPGRYEFFGDFHKQAQGVMIAQ